MMRVRLYILPDAEHGTVAQSRLRRECTRLVRQAAIERERARALRFQATTAKEAAYGIKLSRPAPWWFAQEFTNEPRGDSGSEPF